MTDRRATALASMALALALALAVGGCSAGGGPSAPAATTSPSSVASSARDEPPGLQVGDRVWSTRSSGLERPELLAVGDDVLLVADDRSGGRGTLHVLDADTGRQRWRLDADGPDRFRDVTSASVGPDAAGREVVTLRFERQTCADDGRACRYASGLEAREAGSGRLRWRWRAPGVYVTSGVVTPDAVLASSRGGLHGLDPATGRPLWRTDGALTGAVDDGLGILAPDPGDETYRVLDLTTGEEVSTVESRWGVGAVHAGQAQQSVDGQVVLQDLVTEERQVVDGDADVPPLTLASDDAFAWLSADDRLLTLLPGEEEPTSAPLPEGITRGQASKAFFAGDLAGGVLVVRTPEGVRTMSRHGALDEAVGPRTRSVTDVHDGTVVLGGPSVWFRSDLPIEVRRIR